MNASLHRWKFSALASAACLCAALTATNASALALGAIHVQSHLGEPLRAVIDIPEMTAAEAATLQTAIATPDIFQAHGMEFGNTARSVRVELVRPRKGPAQLRLTTSNAVNDPFVDLILQATWSAGNLVRSYTLLLDPPIQAKAPPSPATPAQASGRSYRSQPRVSTPAAPRTSAATPAVPAAAANTGEGGGSLTVRAGDTAGRLARAHAMGGVSLDQMLVAMLHNNPHAFIGGNVNRVKAGAVLNMPTAEQAQSTSAAEARKIIAAQSKDFNAYRRKLADRVADAQVSAAERSASGKVQAQVQDSSPTAAPADKLTLSKGAVTTEAQLAQEKQTAEQDSRMQELQRNLAELQNISSDAPATTASSGSVTAAGAEASAPATETPPAATPGLQVEANMPVTGQDADAATTTAAADTAEPAQAAAPAAAEPAAEAPKPKKKPVVVAPPEPEPSLLDELLDNPLVPAGGAAIVALLGLLAWRKRKQQTASAAPGALGNETTLDVDQLPPDSLFDSSGGQQIDTSSEGAASTMAYSPSQLDANGDVDPLAEADVYLAYGKDEEALKILQEALRSNPNHLPLLLKLAEIHAKQHDLVQLESTARTVQHITNGQGPDWERVRALGQNMDPYNDLYAAGNAKTGANAAAAAPTAATPASGFAQALAESDASAANAASDAALDLDALLGSTDTPPAPADSTTDSFIAALDSQLDITAPDTHSDLPSQIQDTQFVDEAPAQPEAAPAFDLNSLDLDLPTSDTAAPAATAAEPPSSAPDSLDFTLDSNFIADTALAPAAEAEAASPAPAEEDFGLDKLDFGDLSPSATDTPAAPVDNAPTAEQDFGLDALDLGDLAAPADATPADAGADASNPLTTKLDLAQEFTAIGDTEGARALIEEVLADARGTLKVRAEKMLGELD